MPTARRWSRPGAAEAGKPLRLVAPDGHLESLALAARHGLPLDSL